MADALLKILQNIKDPRVLVILAICAVIWGVQLNYAVMRLSEKTGALEKGLAIVSESQQAVAIRQERLTATLEAIAANVKDNKETLRDIANQMIQLSKQGK